MDTTTNAKSVPMLVSSDSSDSGTNPASAATTVRVTIVMIHGVPKRGVDRGEDRRQQAVAGHREEHPGLAEQQHEDDGGDAADRAQRDQVGRPAWPTSSNALASGAPVLRLVYLVMPVTTAATAT
jgi:hypothetical protein